MGLKAKCEQQSDNLSVYHDGACHGSTTTSSTTSTTSSTTSTTEPTTVTTESTCPDMCMKMYAPVCGTDQITYSNVCFLELAQCNNYPELEVAYQGECIETTTPFKYKDWIGDGECDDITNTAEHGFDGHDCCKQPLKVGSCLECECKEN